MNPKQYKVIEWHSRVQTQPSLTQGELSGDALIHARQFPFSDDKDMLDYAAMLCQGIVNNINSGMREMAKHGMTNVYLPDQHQRQLNEELRDYLVSIGADRPSLPSPQESPPNAWTKITRLFGIGQSHKR